MLHRVAFLLVAWTLPAWGELTLHVRIDGEDSADRDGASVQSAFATLAYAAERLPSHQAGDLSATIRLGPGRHPCDRTAVLPSGTSVFGEGFHGDGSRFSVLVASDDWPLTERIDDRNLGAESIIVVKKGARDIKLYGIQLECPEARPIATGLLIDNSESIQLDTCRFRHFRWCGVGAFNTSKLEIAGCSFYHCSTEKHRHRGGQIYTRYLADSSFHHCRIVPRPRDGGYGYKGGGHTNVRIHDNDIDECYFAIESPHENEYGLRIDHNELHGAISVPKGGQGGDPAERGFQYSVEIDHNIMTDSYAIEGPRNHLRVHHNHIHIDKTGGRVYSQFGGINRGPVRFDHNVIENVDRSILWVREGLAENVTFESNTVYATDASDRTGDLFSVWQGETINDWVIRDNLIVAAWNQPRRLVRPERGVTQKMTITGNLFVNVTDVPPGNLVDVEPGLVRGQAEKPWGYFAPASPTSPAVGAVRWDQTLEPVGPRRR